MDHSSQYYLSPVHHLASDGLKTVDGRVKFINESSVPSSHHMSIWVIVVAAGVNMMFKYLLCGDAMCDKRDRNFIKIGMERI